jgi:adenine/guanine phosphoribosyltransferase-like PRPP-binding protein
MTRSRICPIVEPPTRPVSAEEFARLYRTADAVVVAELLGITVSAVSARAIRLGLRRGKWNRNWKAWPTLRSGVQTLELRVGRLAEAGP